MLSSRTEWEPILGAEGKGIFGRGRAVQSEEGNCSLCRGIPFPLLEGEPYPLLEGNPFPLLMVAQVRIGAMTFSVRCVRSLGSSFEHGESDLIAMSLQMISAWATAERSFRSFRKSCHMSGTAGAISSLFDKIALAVWTGDLFAFR